MRNALGAAPFPFVFGGDGSVLAVPSESAAAARDAMLDAALLKLHLSESFIASSLDAVRTHGGTGYLTEYDVERDLRDAVGGVLYAGTSDIQRNVIAKLLGL